MTFKFLLVVEAFFIDHTSTTHRPHIDHRETIAKNLLTMQVKVPTVPRLFYVSR